MSTLHELFEEGIKDVYNAEKQLTKALPKVIKKVQNEELANLLQAHLEETEQQCRRLEEACESLGIKPSGVVCHGMEGLIEETNEHLEGKDKSPVTDAEIIGSAQKAEHYEIATYGTLCEWAKIMGHDDVLQLLKENMAEEEKADKMLSEIAEREINRMAAEEGGDMEMGSRAKKSDMSGKASVR